MFSIPFFTLLLILTPKTVFPHPLDDMAALATNSSTLSLPVHMKQALSTTKGPPRGDEIVGFAPGPSKSDPSWINGFDEALTQKYRCNFCIIQRLTIDKTSIPTACAAVCEGLNMPLEMMKNLF